MDQKPPADQKTAQIGIIVGAALILFGAIKLSEILLGTKWWTIFQSIVYDVLRFVWPIALIAAGIYLLWAAKSGKIKRVNVDWGRPLRRSLNDKRISGVCGGIAEYLQTDSSIIRILAIILLVAMPPLTLIFYLVATILIPKD